MSLTKITFQTARTLYQNATTTAFACSVTYGGAKVADLAISHLTGEWPKRWLSISPAATALCIGAIYIMAPLFQLISKELIEPKYENNDDPQPTKALREGVAKASTYVLGLFFVYGFLQGRDMIPDVAAFVAKTVALWAVASSVDQGIRSLLNKESISLRLGTMCEKMAPLFGMSSSDQHCESGSYETLDGYNQLGFTAAQEVVQNLTKIAVTLVLASFEPVNRLLELDSLQTASLTLLTCIVFYATRNLFEIFQQINHKVKDDLEERLTLAHHLSNNLIATGVVTKLFHAYFRLEAPFAKSLAVGACVITGIEFVSNQIDPTVEKLSELTNSFYDWVIARFIR